MNDQKKPELTLAQIRDIMRSKEDVPTGRLFAQRAMNTNQEEKQLLVTVNPAQLMQISFAGLGLFGLMYLLLLSWSRPETGLAKVGIESNNRSASG
jgi:hypothetical protein